MIGWNYDGMIGEVVGVEPGLMEDVAPEDGGDSAKFGGDGLVSAID